MFYTELYGTAKYQKTRTTAKEFSIWFTYVVTRKILYVKTRNYLNVRNYVCKPDDTWIFLMIVQTSKNHQGFIILELIPVVV